MQAAQKTRKSICRTSVLAALLVAWTASTSVGQLTFAPATNIPLPSTPDGIAAADFDGDGALDLAVTRDGPDRVSVMIGLGDGTFGPPVDYFTGSGTGAGALAAADLDGDGDMDLAVVLKNTEAVRVLLNAGGTFTFGGITSVGSEPVYVTAADLDGDGAVDLVTANRSGNTISVLMNAGAATFTATTVPVGEEPRAVAIADYTGDGVLDLAISIHRDRTVEVLRGLGNGAFAAHAILSVGSQFRPEGIAAGDLNGDGTMDLAAAISGNGLNFAAIYLNNGAGSFTGPSNFATGGENPSDLVLADLDCDGHLDVATANQDSGTVAILRNTGAGAFAAPQLLTVGTRPERLVSSDLDGDGDSDLAAVNRDSHNVSILINDTCEVALLGDMNCDGVVDFDDIDPFVEAISNPASYQAQYPDCDWSNADTNQDGFVDFDDIDPFITLLGG